MKTKAPSATKRCAVARPIPLLPPVMTATFPSSLLMSFLLFDFPFFLAYFSTAWYRCHGQLNRCNICTDRYGRGIIHKHEAEQTSKTNGTSPLLRYRPSVGPRAAGVLAKGIRGRVSVGPDQSCGRQSSGSVCRLWRQRSAVPQGARPVLERASGLRPRSIEGADRPRSRGTIVAGRGRFEHSPAQSRWMPHGARCARVWRGGRFDPAGTDRLPRGG